MQHREDTYEMTTALESAHDRCFLNTTTLIQSVNEQGLSNFIEWIDNPNNIIHGYESRS